MEPQRRPSNTFRDQLLKLGLKFYLKFPKLKLKTLQIQMLAHLELKRKKNCETTKCHPQTSEIYAKRWQHLT